MFFGNIFLVLLNCV